MSGGSFNYLCSRFGEAEEYEAVHRELVRRGHEDSKAALHILTLVQQLRDAERRARNLEDVLHAIEWTVSGDWDDAQLAVAISLHEKLATAGDGTRGNGMTSDADPKQRAEFAITLQLTADQLALLSDIALRSSAIVGHFVTPEQAAHQLLLREMRRYVR